MTGNTKAEKARLKAAKKAAHRQAQSNDQDTSEKGSADYWAADDALRTLRRRS